MGKVAEIKTKPTDESVDDFINSAGDEQKQNDSRIILELMKRATGEQPKLWGTSIIGFGDVRIKSPNTGREVDWFRIGFSPRKANLSLYLTGDIHSYASDLKNLGKHKTGKGCLYISKLSDVDVNVLESMITKAAKTKKRG